MAIYHCNCKVISRGSGRSAVGAAAYRSGEKLTNEYDGMTHDYTNKGGVVYSEIMLCENAPERYQDRGTLWNEVEQSEKGSRAQLAREYEVALPRELSREEQKVLVRDYVRENFVEKGMCADFAIHDKEDGNPHAHIMLTMRPIEQDGTWGAKQRKEYILDKNGNKQYDKKKQTYKCKTVKTTDWDSPEFLQRNREAWANAVNREFQKKNISQRVDHRTLKEQGVDRVPTIHVGVAANAMEKPRKKRAAVRSDRGEINREIKRTNAELNEVKKEISETEKSIGQIKEDMLWIRIHQHVAMIEKRIKETAGNAKEQTLLKEQLARAEQAAAEVSAQTARTNYHADRVYNVGGKEIGYREFHTSKVEYDIAYLKKRISQNLAEIQKKTAPQQTAPAQNLTQTKHEDLTGTDLQRDAAGTQTLAQTKREDLTGVDQQHKATEAQIETFDVVAVARQLEAHRAAFIKATEQTKERTFYQENPIYRQQAAQIAEYAKTVTDQTASIQSLKTEKAKLGMFQGKRKKELQGKIDNFERLRRENVAKLEALGVKDLAKVDEAIKEKNAMAAQEQAKAQKARENVGASARAEEAKAAYLELAKTVPEDLKPTVLAEMERCRAKPERGTGAINSYMAVIAAERQLDAALKSKQREHTEERRRTKYNGKEK